MGGSGPVVLALLLLVPSVNYQVFDGFPLSRIPEFVGLVLVIPLLASRALRHLHASWVGRWPHAVTLGLGGTAAAALGLKLLLLVSGTAHGFLACYRSPLEPPPIGPCEPSFENPLFRFSVTRLDRAINFGEHDWDLGFLNTVRFDPHYHGRQGRLRWRLPIEASWRGDVAWPTPWVARVSYVGEATVVLDPDRSSRASTALGPHYGTLAMAFVPMPPGRHSLRVDYRFDDGSTQGGPPPEGPWATLRIERGRGSAGHEPGATVIAIKPPWPWRAAAAAGDAAIAALAAPLLIFYAGLLRHHAWLLALVAVATPLVDRFDPAWIGLPTSLGLCLVMAVVVGPVLRRRWRGWLVGSFFALVYVTWFVTLRTFRRLDVVTLRAWAEDPLFYESHARSILETWSLQGGERVFLYQPLFRYLRFAERLVLGEGDGLVSILALAALYWALGWAFARLWVRPCRSMPRRLLFGGVALLMLTLAATPPVVFFVQASLSEYPTWIFLLLLFPMLVASRSPAQWRLGAALGSLSLLTRSNQAPGMLTLLGVFTWRAWRLRPRAAVAALALAVALLSLPPWHNLYYGGRLAVSGQSQPQLFRMPPASWPRLLDDWRVRIVALNQIDHMFYLNPVDDPFPRGDALSRLAIRGLQILWLTTCVLTLRRRGFAPETKVLLVSLPLLYLGVHFVYVVDDYYPRHIIAGHLAMGLVTLNAVGRGWSREA